MTLEFKGEGVGGKAPTAAIFNAGIVKPGGGPTRGRGVGGTLMPSKFTVIFGIEKGLGCVVGATTVWGRGVGNFTSMLMLNRVGRSVGDSSFLPCKALT